MTHNLPCKASIGLGLLLVLLGGVGFIECMYFDKTLRLIQPFNPYRSLSSWSYSLRRCYVMGMAAYVPWYAGCAVLTVRLWRKAKVREAFDVLCACGLYLGFFSLLALML